MRDVINPLEKVCDTLKWVKSRLSVFEDKQEFDTLKSKKDAEMFPETVFTKKKPLLCTCKSKGRQSISGKNKQNIFLFSIRSLSCRVNTPTQTWGPAASAQTTTTSRWVKTQGQSFHLPNNSMNCIKYFFSPFFLFILKRQPKTKASSDLSDYENTQEIKISSNNNGQRSSKGLS